MYKEMVDRYPDDPQLRLDYANTLLYAGKERKASGSRLLLVQPSKVIMFIPGLGVRPFFFSTVCDEAAEQREVYMRVAQDAVVSSLNGMNACVRHRSNSAPARMPALALAIAAATPSAEAPSSTPPPSF